MTDTPTPVIGQTWQDNDPRSYGRRLHIVEIDDTHAVCEEPPRPGRNGQAKPGRRTRIHLDRFRPTSTGYRYVSGPS